MSSPSCSYERAQPSFSQKTLHILLRKNGKKVSFFALSSPKRRSDHPVNLRMATALFLTKQHPASFGGFDRRSSFAFPPVATSIKKALVMQQEPFTKTNYYIRSLL
jgi:hypothetical protein